MEERLFEGRLEDRQENIPIQMMTLTDRDGRMTPLWFRLETEEHEVRTCRIEKKYVGVREKQFICKTRLGKACKTLEMRYSVETQKWRIFQFL